MNLITRHLLLALLASCAPIASDDADPLPVTNESRLTGAQKMPRYTRIRDVAASRGLHGKAFLLAGIAHHESGMAQCYSEASQYCPGPNSPDCGGGPVMAGGGDGPCPDHAGGLGMFQFDAGSYADTVRVYGASVLTVDGQIDAAVDFVVRIVKISAYTTNAETDAKALQWLNDFDIGDGKLRDQWIRTVLRYYNGCPEGGSCWSPRYHMYDDALSAVLAETNGAAFWTSAADPIDQKYAEVGGELGAPLGDEQGAPDGAGRYRVYEHGSIYWSQATGAHEVHGRIRDEWKTMGWEAGILGYPITDETPAPDGVGRYGVFEHGSIYWTPKTDAHEVHGRIRDAWKDAGWEAGKLGYPIADEVAIPGGAKSVFEHGFITWDEKSNTTKVTVQQ